MSRSTLGVIALVPDAWDDIVMPRHHVIGRLAKHFPVVWIEPARNWRDHFRPGGAHFLVHDRWSQPMPGLDVLSTGWRHPAMHRPQWLARASLASRLRLARNRLIDRGATRIALYIWRDDFAGALDLIEHDFSCYHLDDEYSFSDQDMPIPERELRLLQRVDQVVVHSPALLAKKGHVNPRTVLIPNGVDYRKFSDPATEPADIGSIPHPRVGYAGVIKKQLDLALLARLAAARPHHSFVLVGPVMNVAGKEAQLQALLRLSNVHWLGAKAAAALPGYMQHFDVCVMCYEVNGYTRYIYPLKLNEYLATGRPTISSPIETVQQFSSVVCVAGSDSEWLAAIDQSLSGAANTAAAVEARRTFAKDNDWDALVDHIATLFPQPSAGIEPALMATTQSV